MTTTTPTTTFSDYAARVHVRRPDLAARNEWVTRHTFKFEVLHGNPLLSVPGIPGHVRWGPIIEPGGRAFLVFCRQPSREVTSDLAVTEIFRAHNMKAPSFLPLEAEASTSIQGTRLIANLSASAVQSVYDRIGHPSKEGSVLARTLRPCLTGGALRIFRAPSETTPSGTTSRVTLIAAWAALH